MTELLFFVEVVVAGLLAGTMYSLVALGFVLIYKASSTFNFAQGAMVFFAVLAFVGFMELGLPFFLAFIVTILIGAIIFIIWQGIEMVHMGGSGGIEKKEFFQFILFTVMLGTSIGSIPDLFAKIQKSIGATESLINIIQQETEKIDATKPVSNSKFLTGRIELKNLNFNERVSN